MIVKCSVCEMEHHCLGGDLSWFCSECSNLLAKGYKHNDHLEAYKDMEKRHATWKLEQEKGVL